ncbi:DNA polymerase III subunit gamma/tau [Candidatus Woesebacteria bacterium]|nr:DNA polymerase III subunit gamma/tau [Candidatus Woesebacteria bacterium]
MNWNRTYRPQTIKELHLERVRAELEQILQSGSMPQVLLFAGPKGTGKTSAARILGAVVNTPNNKASVNASFFGQGTHTPFLDETESDLAHAIFTGNSFVVRELDAASNRGIDEIRQLKETAHLPPSHGMVSVFILDEAHMLTTEAFNALLKLLEEPPSYTLFVLATTEPHKIPGTITSRARTIQFQKATTAEITAALKRVLHAESISFEDEAISTIARSADGSFRDAITLAQSLVQGNTLTTQMVDAHTHISRAVVQTCIEAIITTDASAVTTLFATLRQTGASEQQFHQALVEFLHTELLACIQGKSGESEYSQEVLLFLLNHFNDTTLVSTTALPFLGLELAALSLITRAEKKRGGSGGGSRAGQLSKKKETKAKPPTTQTKTVTPKDEVKPSQGVVSAAPTHHESGDYNLVSKHWDSVVTAVAEENTTLAALLRSSTPEASESMLILKVYYQFHQEQIMQPKFSTIVQDALNQVAGGAIAFSCQVEQPLETDNVVEVDLGSQLSQVQAALA